MKLITKLFLLLLFMNFNNFSWARDLIIAGIPEEPNRWKDESGKIVGFDVDVIDAIMTTIKVPYSVKLYDSSAKLEQDGKSDSPSIDMVFTYSKNEERQKYLKFPKESHVNFNWNFFVLKENEKIKFESYKDLKPYKIGITTGISYSDEFLKAIKEVPLTVDEIVRNENQLKKLLAKRFDMVPLNTKSTLYEAKKDGFLDKIAYLPKPIKDKSYYNTFVIKSNYPELDKIIEKYDISLAEIKKNGTLKKLMSKYSLE